MALHGSLGTLLQGVSQQPAHIRTDGQVTEQINMLSDVVEGITSRPPLELQNIVAGLPLDVKFVDFTIGQTKYYLVHTDTEIYITDAQGNIQTLLTPDGTAYLGEDLTVYTYDNTVYVINRNRVVETIEAQQDRKEEVVTDIGLVSCLGGLFSHTYSITIEDANGSKLTATYTAPDGIADGDAAKTTSDYIIAQLARGLLGNTVTQTQFNQQQFDARSGQLLRNIFREEQFEFNEIDLRQFGALSLNPTIKTAGSILLISGVEGLKISVEDGSGGDSLRQQTSIAKSTDNLAEFAPNGTLVKVIGLDGTEDDFYMRFDVNEDVAVGEGFGSDGVWREWFDPFTDNEFNEDTMPHILSLDDGVFTFKRGVWQGRRTGDENTNPFPSFVGRSIRDINGIQSRLVFVSGPNTVMSRTNIATDFFKQSVVADTASDPIDITSTSEEEYTLNWVVPFDRDLVIFSEDAQFLISGAGALTPTNAALVETTGYEVNVSAKPVSTGRTLLFPFNSGSFSGIKEFYSINTDEANTAVDITKVQDKYIRGDVVDIQVSTNFSTVLVRAEVEPNTIYVHQYYWNGSDKAQQAWSRWVFDFPVKSMYFDNSEIHLTLQLENSLAFCVLDLDRQEDATGYTVSLDMKEYHTVLSDDIGSYIDSPLGGLVLVQSTGCEVLGSVLAAESETISGGYRYRFSNFVAPASAELISGLSYRCSIKPTMPFIRDAEGRVQLRSKLVVTDFAVYYNDSGYIGSVMTSRYRSEDFTFTNEEIQIDEDLDDVNKIGTKSGVWTFGWGERSDWSELELFTEDVRPITITEVEWFGQALTRGRRV